jgi:hypothetical protein
VIFIFAWGHPSYTALTGIGFAVARTNRNTLVKLIAPVIGLGMAMLAHSFHNTAVTFVSGLGGLVLTVLVEWAGLFVMLCFTIWMIIREQGLLKRHLWEEVANGLLSQKQYNTALSFFPAALPGRMRLLTKRSTIFTSAFRNRPCSCLPMVCGEYTGLNEMYRFRPKS